MGPVDYSSATPPPEYKCSVCGASGVKLWREYNMFFNHQTYRCVDCACHNQKKAVAEVNIASGWVGNLVAAVPTPDGESYWGLSSIPKDGVDWWQRLPLRRSHG